jgi:hypothetical protein
MSIILFYIQMRYESKRSEDGQVQRSRKVVNTKNVTDPSDK